MEVDSAGRHRPVHIRRCFRVTMLQELVTLPHLTSLGPLCLVEATLAPTALIRM